jgi:hypothetical protein
MAVITLCQISGQSNTNDDEFKSQRGFYLGGVFTTIKNPTFRPISHEVVIPQTAYLPGFNGGYWLDTRHLGMGTRIFVWHTSFEDFATEEMPGSPTIISLSEPTFSHISLDLLLEWIIPRKSFFGIYGLAGLALSRESYFISGATFDIWNGEKNLTEFDYSYGLGIRISPIKWISIISEIRWIPGVATTPLKFLYSKNNVNYYAASGETRVKNKTPVISAGLSLNLSIFKNKNKSNNQITG